MIMAGAAANDLEEGAAFTPRFSADGLVTCVAVDAVSGEGCRATVRLPGPAAG